MSAILRGMALFPIHKILGIHLTPSGVSFVLIAAKQGRPSLLELNTYGNDVKPLDILKTHAPLIVTSLPPASLLIREVSLPPIKNKDKLEAAIAFQAEPLLPYPLEEGMIAYHKEGAYYSIGAARKKSIQEHLEILHGAGIEPDSISTPAFAIKCLNRFLPDSMRARVFILLEEEGTTCLYFLNQKMHHMRYLPIGLCHLVEAAAKDRKISLEEARLVVEKHLDFTSLSPHVFPELFALQHKLVLQLKRILDGFEENGLNGAFETVFLGEVATLSGFTAFLTQALELSSIELTVFNLPFQAIQTHALALGLALSGMGPRPEFRTALFSHPSPWRRIKKPLAIYGTICATVTLLLLGTTFFVQAREEASLHEKALQIERAQQAIFPFQEKVSEAKTTKELLHSLQKTATLPEPFPFPLAPSIPSVSEFLIWLSTHPSAYPPNGEPLIFERISYELVNRPTKKTPKEHYRVRIELEFTTPSARQARAFHEALRQADAFVSNKDDIQWNVRNKTYSVSFFLKDKTAYPV